MKYTTIIGLLLIAIGAVACYVSKMKLGDLFQEPEFALGLMFGGGLGLLFGGFIGWLYKKRNVKHVVKQPVQKTEEDSTPPSGSHNI